jgi:hypothetical protein
MTRPAIAAWFGSTRVAGNGASGTIAGWQPGMTDNSDGATKPRKKRRYVITFTDDSAGCGITPSSAAGESNKSERSEHP